MQTAVLFTQRRFDIVRLLAAHPGLSTRDVALAMCVDDGTADYHLRRLVNAGVVQRRKRGRALAHYLTGVSP
jgi:DNA-binding MarR family transcriptional regulator